MATPTSVLIFYANDPGHGKTYRRIVAWLKDRSEEQYREIGARVEEDLLEFPFSIDRDLGGIWRGILSSADELSKMGIAIFTNEFAAERKWLYGTADSGELWEGFVRLPEVDREQFRLHPLSHPDVFSSALEAIGEVFREACSNCTLVTKSHGNDRLALTSLFSGMLDHSTPEEFFEELEEKKALLEPSFKHWLDRPLSIDAASGLGFTHLGFTHLRELINGIGTEKHQYLSVLKDAGKLGMHFKLVVMESCDSHLSPELVDQIPDNVDRLLTSTTTVPYTSTDYRKAFQLCRQGTSVSDALLEVIREPFALQSRK